MLSTNYLLDLSKKKPIYAIPEEDTIIVTDDKINIIGTRPFYIFEDGVKYEKNPKEIDKNDCMSK